MDRRPAWALPSSISLPFSTNLVSSLTSFLPSASISSVSNPIASFPPPPPASPPHSLQSTISSPRSLFESFTRSLHWILRWRRADLPAAALGPAPRPRLRPQSEAGCAVPLFRPYVAKVPWHGGVRGFFSQLFPRYGHYCGPNWSSGKDGGSMLWDRRPVDWLDFCCYCHDIGYDTHDQEKLLKADVAFLQCLERPTVATKGGGIWAASLYRTMCVVGLRNFLIPYRMNIIRLHSQLSLTELCNNLISTATSLSKIVVQKRKDML